MKFLLEGIDRLGKSTLVTGIQQERGFHFNVHFSKPLRLACYNQSPVEYQRQSFAALMPLLQDSVQVPFIFDRAHLGEYVYGPMYRQTSGGYVFDLELQHRLYEMNDVRLILLTEDFSISRHFVDDGLSLGSIENREREQELFIEAFERSHIKHKRMICVTDQALGGFRPSRQILLEALEC